MWVNIDPSSITKWKTLISYLVISSFLEGKWDRAFVSITKGKIIILKRHFGLMFSWQSTNLCGLSSKKKNEKLLEWHNTTFRPKRPAISSVNTNLVMVQSKRNTHASNRVHTNSVLRRTSFERDDCTWVVKVCLRNIFIFGYYYWIPNSLLLSTTRVLWETKTSGSICVQNQFAWIKKTYESVAKNLYPATKNIGKWHLSDEISDGLSSLADTYFQQIHITEESMYKKMIIFLVKTKKIT